MLRRNRAKPHIQAGCTGTTGHAEVAQIGFDPTVISYEEILRIFFTVHDPMTLNRQGADIGTQYRSIIFYHDEKQKATAERIIRETESSGMWGAPIVTKVEPFRAFYKAEDYHQEYFKNNQTQPYCQMAIAPKVAKLRKSFQERLKKN